MIINIENLKLRTIVGVFDWEKRTKQDVVVNITIEFDGEKAGESDDIKDTVDYKHLNKKIISYVETNKFNLLEKMAVCIGKIVMENEQVKRTTVKVDKPGALRFAESVSITHTIEHDQN